MRGGMGIARRVLALSALGLGAVGGMLYVNSGYFFQGSAPGNVLLAFSVDGK
jgi:polyvinyl alcohol dehydrogenase (cytochrome)